MNKSTTAIVTPVFNDWDSFDQLINDIDVHLAHFASNVVVFAVNDGSTSLFGGVHPPQRTYKVIKRIEILHLARNVGHQRAIAVGLAYLEKNFHPDQIIVMDADGEDGPSDIPGLMAEQNKTGKIVFARRGQRKEGTFFKFYYTVYRQLFHLLTGKKIGFGNFCIIPGTSLRQIVFLPEIWGHFASGVLRSGLPHETVLIDRRQRYHGTSRMNFTGLVMHGLSAFSVYTDIISVRLILFTLLVILFVLIGGITLMYIRYFTDLAIPGWATTVGFGLVMVLLQSLLLLLSLIFNILNSRSAQIYIPAKHFEDFLLGAETVYGKH